jgi:uroporphyrinogen-III decarboxylase
VLHICGNTDAILESMTETGADGLELDQKTDSSLARDILGNRMAFFGNIDPSEVLARGTVALVERKTTELLELFADTPRFVLNAGCAIPAETPSENIRAMIRTARNF